MLNFIITEKSMTNNFCVIMAGGVGSRFWPFSTEENPKQFLDFMGTGRSLLQMTADRLKGVIETENILIVTNKRYKEKILEQLPEIREEQVLLEPIRRNTAPCIAYATYKIYAKCPKANIVVLPSDHLIADTDEFRKILAEGLRFVSLNDALLTLGIKPTRPETGYGYIQYSHGGGALRKVKTFTEKPNIEMAKVFLASGEFCWNSGMFIWKAETIIDEFERELTEIADTFSAGAGIYNTEKEQEWIDKVFPTVPSISIDYGIMEKASNVYVMLSDFGWSDMGTWSALYELSQKDEQGNCKTKGEALLYNCKDDLVVLGDGEMAVIDGLEGYLVAHNKGTLLICKKDDEARIRTFVDDVQKMKKKQ